MIYNRRHGKKLQVKRREALRNFSAEVYSRRGNSRRGSAINIR